MSAPSILKICHLAKNINLNVSVQHCRLFSTVQSVRLSRYNTEYIDPSVSKYQYEEEIADDDPRRFQPIKAAANEQTSSVVYDPLVAKFTRMMIISGHKEIARKCMDRTFEHIKLIQLEKYHKAAEDERADIELDPLTIFHKAVENCKPLLITQRTRRGGITYTVPVPVSKSYQLYKAMNWLIETCREKENWERWYWEKLSAELLAAANNQGKTIRKKQELHRLCEANRAYAHYRW